MLTQIILYALVPAVAIFVGGIIASYRPPTKNSQSFVQHIAAGVVFAALVGEVLPDLTEKHPQPVWVILGFAAGVALMLVMREVIEHKIAKPGEVVEDPTSLILVVGLDVLIDGTLIGVGIRLGANTGALLAIALGIEILFLGLSTGAEMVEARYPRKRIFTTLLILTVPPILGVFLGGYLLAGMTDITMVVVLSFAAAALLYLVTEELLVEAHSVPETPFATGAFFVGFLVFYIMELVL